MILPDFLGKLNQDIINYYGMPNQVNQLMEECGETIAAANHYLRSGKDQKQQAEDDFKQEMVDVAVVIHQIINRMGMTEEEFRYLADYKIRRQLARINKKGG